jgi:energy-converting hydrogenase Eha subunit A
MNEEYNEHNDIVGDFYNNNIIMGGFRYNNIKSNFYNNILNKYAVYNNILNEINDINFGTSSLIYDNYNCNIFKNSGGTLRLSYYNESDVLTITDVVEISVPSNYITFVDPNVKAICVANWGSNGEITYEQAAVVTDLSNKFASNETIVSFNELQYFTGVVKLGKLVEEMESETEIANAPFFACTNLTSIVLPQKLQILGVGVFFACTNLTSIVLPNSLTLIANSAFRNCSSLLLLNIPNSVISIESYAFYGCSGLTSITIGNSITSIGYMAFHECINLTSVIMDATIPPILNIGAFDGDTNLAHIYVPVASVDTYKAATDWSNYASIISAIIDMNQPITFADSAVKALCVANWGSGGEITYAQASAVTTLGSVFTDNASIISFNELQYFTGLTSLNKEAFTRCSNLVSIILPSSIITLENGLMASSLETSFGCFLSAGLTSITIPNSVTSIGDVAFGGCINLTSVDIPNSVTSIGDVAFGGCINLTSINIPNSVTSIGDYAFGGCINLTSINIPNSVTSIGNNTFDSCSGLTSITIPNSVTSIGDSAFRDCIGLTSITIPNSVTSIGIRAFSHCSVLTSITIPNSVTSIGNFAFRDCSGLTSATIKALTPPTVGPRIFSGDTNLIHIYVPEASVNVYKAAEGWSEYASIICAEIVLTDPIVFADSAVKAICVANWGSNGELTYEQAAAVTTLGSVFTDNASIISFNELQYFTGLTSLNKEAFTRCSNLVSIILPSSIITLENGLMASSAAPCFWHYWW